MDFERDPFLEEEASYLQPDQDQDPAGHTIGGDGAGPAHAMLPPPSADEVAAAFERKLRRQREEEERKAAAEGGHVPFDHNHEKRQEFRRLIDPGIMRPNARPVALEALETLLKLAENIIAHPDEPKYQRFKTTNHTIKRILVDPKGTLEYARALGFNPEVEKFQPLYVFNKKRHMEDLKIGADILREALDRELTKEERAAQAKREEKAVAAAQIANIKQQFLDDRKSQAAVARREQETRNRSAEISARTSMSPPTSPRVMPGTGHNLRGDSIAIDED